MNEVMVERWNSVVKPYDKVYHLGDFCFGRGNIAIAARLNGNKRLIMGNHDIYRIEEYMQYFKSCHGVRFWEGFMLTHVPIHPNQMPDRARGNIHGHLHTKRVMFDFMAEPVEDLLYYCVSVEQNNLTPISADVILDRFK